MMKILCVVVVLTVGVCWSQDVNGVTAREIPVSANPRSPIGGRVSQDEYENEAKKVHTSGTKCNRQDSTVCFMYNLSAYMDRMLKKATIHIGDDLEITQNSPTPNMIVDDDKFARAGDTDEEQISQHLIDKLWTFIKTRSLRWRMFDDAELVVVNTPEADGSMNIGMSINTPGTAGDGRGKMKNLAPFLVALAVKFGILGGLAFKGLVLLVGKALLVSKIALLLAGIIGLKKLFSHQKHVTYEVVSHPHHSHETSIGHDTYNSAWGRESSGRSNGETSAQEMAYSAQVPPQRNPEVAPEGSVDDGSNREPSKV